MKLGDLGLLIQPYLPAAFALLAFIVLLCIVYKLYQQYRSYRELEDTWGEMPNRIYSPNEMQRLRYFDQKRKTAFHLDNQTCSELELDDVFKAYNATLTSAGDEAFYRILRRPLLKMEDITSRAHCIAFFKDQRKTREKLRRILAKLGRLRGLDIIGLVAKNDFSPLWFFSSIALTTTIAVFIFLSFSSSLFFLIILAALLLINLFLYLFTHKKVLGRMDSLSYFVHLMPCARSITKVDAPPLSLDQNALRAHLRALGAVRGSKILWLMFRNDTPLAFLKFIFPLEIIFFELLKRILYQQREAVIGLYDHVGQVDALLCAASLRDVLPRVCVPTFSDHGLAFHGMMHPLRQNALPQDGTFSSCAVIAGPQGAGKTTLLRSVMLNAVLAQTLLLCTASSFETMIFRPYTSLQSLGATSPQSPLHAQIHSLSRISQASAESGPPLLCTIEEMLKSAHPQERAPIICAFLSQLAATSALCLTATDDEPYQDLDSAYEHFHLASRMQEDRLIFDHQLRPGEWKPGMATQLLRQLGELA